MKVVLTITAIMIFQIHLFGQHRIDSLVGEWKLEKYFSPEKNTEVKTSVDNGCENFLILRFHKNKKVDLVFTDQKDTIEFSGKISFLKDGTIKLRNSIHEIIYLGELEKCITAPLRIEMRGIFFRTFDYSVSNNQLQLIFNLPEDLQSRKQMVFRRSFL